jgi:hypothetical protein
MERHKYTPKEASFIKRHIAGRSRAEMTRLFNMQHFSDPITEGQLSNFMSRYGLRNGLLGKSLQGRTPHNKDMKGYCPKGSEKGWFKPGHKSPHCLPVGSERCLSNTVLVKYSNRKGPRKMRWKSKHALIWERAHGKIPRGHVVIFADGNHWNFAIDNLLLVSRAELVTMNHLKLISTRKEITRTGKTLAGLKMAVAERKRRIKKTTSKTRRKSP